MNRSGQPVTLLIAATLLAALPVRAAGRARPAPPPAQASAAEELSTSSEDLSERKLEGPSGGVALHLNGRFQSLYVGSISADGRLRAGCRVPEQGKGRKKPVRRAR